MRFLENERLTLAKFLPGLDELLAGFPPDELERPGNPGIAAFKRCGGPGLLVPPEHGGAGAGALDAIRVQRAIGARSPSTAVATTMHHFSMASLVVLSRDSQGFEWMLMEGIAREGKLLASGFAEGRPGSSILAPTMSAESTDDGLRISGVKRPCSLARSMDLLTASVLVPRRDGPGEQLAIALVPSESDGLTVSPFWSSFALAGAESEQVTVDDVFVPEELVIRVDAPPGQTMDALQIAGFVWFELLITASYLGAASGLVERALHNARIPPGERARLLIEIEAAAGALENVARQVVDGALDQELLAACLIARYAVQDAIARLTPRAVELLGGLNFMSSDEIGYRAACVHALALHPPSRGRMAEPLTDFLAGGALTIV
ncbi:acyl-CoA dehydrogenase family protein [Actinoplanes sp. NPDC049118]|uniref:acyl-CoA dehydrogenase family protein n=1 Tax=Actinoplanes sp. NPDC049118 TaxID=3155769 RepID=UPI0033F50677